MAATSEKGAAGVGNLKSWDPSAQQVRPTDGNHESGGHQRWATILSVRDDRVNYHGEDVSKLTHSV